jgi:3-oxoacyl-[acyl-carrier protein] reductase
MSPGPALAGKAALVTGGSRGIGRAIALAFAAEGADVAFSYHRDARAARDVVGAAERLGRHAYAFASDAGNAAEVEALVAESVRRLGHLDLVIANAGIAAPARWDAVSPETWGELLATNLLGPYHLLRAARPHLPAGGAAVLVASIAGLLAMPEELPYAASKAALLSLTRSFALAFAPAVRVNAVAPGWVRTDMNAALHEKSRTREALERTIPRGRWGEPDDVAAAVVFLVSDGARFITGETLVVDGGGSIRWRAGVEG